MTIKILQGDCIEMMRTMDAESVDCVVTSPPYWGLRDYGVEGQIGLEPTLGEHLEKMVEVFAEIWRVLKPTGTVWLNYGDCYATTPNGRSAAATKAAGNDDRTFRDKPFSTVGAIYDPGHPKRTIGSKGSKHEVRGWEEKPGRVIAGGTLKPKDLCMIPNRLAIALQDWGWWVRSEIIWAKPNPMPESVTDRPASSHEKIFLLSKSARYFYDHEAVKEPITESSAQRLSQDLEQQVGSTRANGGTKTNGTMKAVGHKNLKRDKPRKEEVLGISHKGWSESMTKDGEITHRNLRNVWTITTQPFSEAHFATFPPKLAETCIKAGCPEDGVVFDPFGGAGTTGLVADQLQRDCILIELNPEYIDISEKRIKNDGGMFTDIEVQT